MNQNGSIEDPEAVLSQDMHFLPFAIETLRANSSIDCQLFLKLKDIKFIKYKSPGTVFNSEIRTRLIDRGHKNIYVKSNEYSGLGKFLELNLKQVLGDSSIENLEKTKILYTTTSFVSKVLLSNPITSKGVKTAQKFVNQTAEFITSQPKVLKHLFEISSINYYTYTHQVHVMMYSIALANQIGLDSLEELKQIGNSALFHDIGKVYIDQNLLNKAGKLNPIEFDQIKKHPELGFKALRETDTLSFQTLNTILRHHERLDGLGYPSGWTGTQIDLSTRIVTIADIFDALTTRRVYREDMGTFPALTIMKAYIGTRIDEKVFNSFIKLLGKI